MLASTRRQGLADDPLAVPARAIANRDCISAHIEKAISVMGNVGADKIRVDGKRHGADARRSQASDRVDASRRPPWLIDDRISATSTTSPMPALNTE
jgi:hypothetical protein